MRINIARSAGFCFGVKRALAIALQAAGSGKKIYMLGDIVHNEVVVKRIVRSGIEKIRSLSRSPGRGSVLLIRAHGAPKNTFLKASLLGYEIIDATCPMVKEIHKIAKSNEGRGYRIIVIGDKEHDEVRGIIGDLQKNSLVIEGPGEITPRSTAGIKKACVVVQSTQNIDKVMKILASLKKNIPDIKFCNTICKPTSTKQEEIKVMPSKNDVMLVIGSKDSANTKRLYEISKSLNKRSYWVNSPEDIKKAWFNKAKNVGITAGASTPEESIQQIIQQIKILNS